ncbi:olfactory receptor 1019-like [Tachyglossus aculeatus]|uniref:olfactory receptor 1019-like n=1 Tax=Tachyglossus aculeatus TaxID=9261 RepID=UPI0018F6FCE1|nr:olfactory receptor 1019-like [Tachyglossus aculeatus]
MRRKTTTPLFPAFDFYNNIYQVFLSSSVSSKGIIPPHLSPNHRIRGRKLKYQEKPRVDEGNYSAIAEFIFLVLSNDPDLQIIVFVVFLMIYMITVLGNLGIILLIKIDAQLHTSMYFFLSNLAFLDTCFSCVIAPRIPINFLVERKTISYAGCVTQICFFAALGTTECFLLGAMAYDHFITICHPLHYSAMMSHRISVFLIVGSYMYGFLNSVIHTVFTFSLSISGHQTINHCFCNGPPLLSISCSNTCVNQKLLFVFVNLNGLSMTAIIVVSYAYILFTILKIHSSEGIHKAFTCASHIMVVSTFYGTTCFMYLLPMSSYSLERDKRISVLYTFVIPMLNPLIYSVSNKEMKDAMRKNLVNICKHPHFRD